MRDSVPNSKETYRNLNQHVLSTLQRDGADLEKTHAIRHQFHLQDDNSVGILRCLLLASGYRVTKVAERVNGAAVSVRYAVEAEVKAVPEKRRLDEMTDYCVDLATIAGAQYDGWTTSRF